MALTSIPSRPHGLGRLVRYGSVSVISTLTSLTVLGLLVGVAGLGAAIANVTATAVGTVPSFELNRRWVWSDRANQRRWRQIVPYVSLSFSGLIVSTVAVQLASNATDSSTRLVHTAAVMLANLGSYGALWLIQFALCDRVLFRSTSHPAPMGEVDDRLRPTADLLATCSDPIAPAPVRPMEQKGSDDRQSPSRGTRPDRRDHQQQPGQEERFRRRHGCAVVRDHQRAPTAP